MDDPLFCARCSRTLTPGDGSFFVVTIDAVADPSGPSVTGEPPSAEELRRQIETLLEQLRDTSAQEAMDEVHRRLTIHLCRGCFRTWIENPAGCVTDSLRLLFADVEIQFPPVRCVAGDARRLLRAVQWQTTSWERPMPTVSIPDPTFRRLAERAAALNITVEELVTPILEQLAANGAGTLSTPPHDEWQRQFDAWMTEVAGRAGRYPTGFELDVSRERMYEGRGE